MTETADLRARRVLLAWRTAQWRARGKRGPSAFHQKDMPLHASRPVDVMKWNDSQITRLFQYGPDIDDLDDVEAMTGISIYALIARPNDPALEGPQDATERQMLYAFRAATPAMREAVLTLLQGHAAQDATTQPAPPDEPVPYAVTHDSTSAPVRQPRRKRGRQPRPAAQS